MKSEPIPETWRKAYLRRPVEQLPADVVQACDEIRSQSREINSLRSQVLRWKIKNAVLMGLIGGLAAKGIEVAVLALIKLFAR